MAYDIEVDTVNRELQGNVYTIHIGDLHPLGGKSVLNMYDLFDYSVLGELTELWDRPAEFITS